MATVVNVLDKAQRALEDVVQKRAAPDDVINVSVALTMVEDSDGENTAGLIVFLSAREKHEDGAVTCTAQVACGYLGSDKAVETMADGLWDLLQGQRMVRAMKAMGLGEGVGEDCADET